MTDAAVGVLAVVLTAAAVTAAAAADQRAFEAQRLVTAISIRVAVAVAVVAGIAALRRARVATLTGYVAGALALGLIGAGLSGWSLPQVPPSIVVRSGAWIEALYLGVLEIPTLILVVYAAHRRMRAETVAPAPSHDRALRSQDA